MAIDNKDKKVLKSSIEREQNEVACSAECEKIKGSKNLNVPHLRFPEFSGEWKKCIIQDYGEVITGNTPPTNNAEYYNNGSYLWASPADLGTGKKINDTKTKLSESGFKKTRIIPKGSILVTCIGSTIGKMGMAVETMSSNQQINSIIVNEKSNNDFVYYAISRAFPRYLSEVGVQAVPILSKSNFEKLPNYTTSIEEQDKTGYFLNLLDERIATQNKIIEDLKKLKSAISKYLFARKDLLETTICLSNIATLKNGYAFQSGKYNALGKWKILTITNVPGERYINDEDCNCIINLPNDIQDHQVLKEGDILISLTGNVGRVSLCKNGNYLLNQRVGLLQLAKNVNQEFLYQILSSQRFENSMIACGQGAAQMNIGKGDVENYVLPYSSNGNNILFAAKILHSYDECIINELRRLTLLTMQKQYLLTQMFI